jgi:5'-nucleotidase (lipoprotein e(P4) family)
MYMNRRLLAPFLLAILVIGCAHHDAHAPVAPACPEVQCPPATHELLLSTLYLQTAAELEAAALQTYDTARRMVEEALQRPEWSALDGVETEGKPPAVIVDVDETILSNAAYEARLVHDEAEFQAETWTAWVNEAVAVPIPGALEFSRWASEQGVVIFYVTNRNAEEKEGTFRNLARYGFPLEEGVDVILTRGGRPEWGSDKTSRRQLVASDYRVLLLIGDDLGDFVPRTWTDVESRRRIVQENRDKWGREWLMLPNPMYGSWLNAIFAGHSPQSRDERLELLYQALETQR